MGTKDVEQVELFAVEMLHVLTWVYREVVMRMKISLAGDGTVNPVEVKEVEAGRCLMEVGVLGNNSPAEGL